MLTFLAAAEDNAVTVIFRDFGVTLPYFIASCINFAVVLLVLRKFAFKPIQAMLEERRDRIAQGEEKIKLIEKQLEESEQTTAAAIAKASEESARLILEAKQGATAFTEQKAQEAIAQAQQILAKAEIAAKADRDRLTLELKREFGRLVATTASQVTGKVLTDDDQRRLNEETLARVEG